MWRRQLTCWWSYLVLVHLLNFCAWYTFTLMAMICKYKRGKRQQNEEFCDERKRFMWSCKAIDLMDCKSFDRKIGSWKELLWWSVESGEKLLSLSLRLISPKMFSQFSLNFKKFKKFSLKLHLLSNSNKFSIYSKKAHFTSWKFPFNIIVFIDHNFIFR